MALMTFASWLNVVGSWAHSWASFNDIFIKAPNIARRPENPPHYHYNCHADFCAPTFAWRCLSIFCICLG